MPHLSPFIPARWPQALPARYWLAGARVPAALRRRVSPRLGKQPLALLVEDGRIARWPRGPRATPLSSGSTAAPCCRPSSTPTPHLDKGDLLAAGLAPSATSSPP
jgi:hypothetical protein